MITLTGNGRRNVAGQAKQEKTDHRDGQPDEQGEAEALGDEGGHSPSLPGHLPEARHLVRIGLEDEVGRRRVIDRQRIERHGVGALRDQG